MTKVVKLIAARLVLAVALLPALLLCAMMVREILMSVVGKVYFRYTYIELINTPTYGDSTIEYLQDFSSFADYKIISFHKIKYGRPVEIREMTDSYELSHPGVLGIASPGLTACYILVKKRQPDNEYRETLIHEYLHCMGYMHVSDRKDLMYYAMNPVDKEGNIRQYAKKVEKSFYE